MSLNALRGGVQAPYFVGPVVASAPAARTTRVGDELEEIRSRRLSPAAKRRAAAAALTRADVSFLRHPHRRSSVQVHERILDQIIAADEAENPLVAAVGRREIGGYLFTWKDGPVICHFEAAYSCASANRVRLDPTQTFHLDVRYRMIGELHVHPTGCRAPSDLDLVAVASGAAQFEREFFSVIASISPSALVSLSGLVAERRRASSGPAFRVEPVDVEVVYS